MKQDISPISRSSWAILSIMVLAVALLSSCDKEYFFFQAVDIDDDTWNQADDVQLEFSTQDTTSLLDFYFDIRNTDDYPYRNIYAFILMEFPNGRTLTDTLHFPDMATADGRWTGSGVGSSFDNSILYKHRRKLPLPGEYSIRITHGMRDTLLQGIARVGIHIESSSGQ